MIRDATLKANLLKPYVLYQALRKAEQPLIAERFNSTLINMLGTLEANKKVDWKSHIGSMVHAYNCTKHDTTGFSPYFLMFGCHPRIVVDLVLGRHEPKCAADYVSNLRDRLKIVLKFLFTGLRLKLVGAI